MRPHCGCSYYVFDPSLIFSSSSSLQANYRVVATLPFISSIFYRCLDLSPFPAPPTWDIFSENKFSISALTRIPLFLCSLSIGLNLFRLFEGRKTTLESFARYANSLRLLFEQKPTIRSEKIVLNSHHALEILIFQNL